MHFTEKTLLLSLSFGIITACGSTLEPPPPPPPPDTSIATTDNGDGTLTSVIDASSETEWIYLDFESKAAVEPSNPDDSTEWDVAFQRFKTKVNGGVNGTGSVEAAVLEGTNFGAVTAAPGDGYQVDAEDGDDEGEIPDYAISIGPSSETGPWGYDIENHQLSNSGAVVIVKSNEGNFYKLQYEEYYGEGGIAGVITLRWAELDSQLEPGVIVISVQRGYTHLSISQGAVVDVTDPENSMDWDLAVNQAAWQTNSGATRMGYGGARLASANTFDTVTEAPTIGFTTDENIPYPGPPGAPDFEGNALLTDWFDYDSTNHTTTPKDFVYLIRGGDGSYGKLRILNYDEPTFTYRLKLEPVTRLVEINSVTVDARNRDGWAYVSLRDGVLVEPEDAASDASWDVALSGARLKTNSGTSGSGVGGAAEATETALEGIDSPPATFMSDEMINDPENPGAMYSGNPALASWYEVSTSTTPRDAAYVLKTADGGYVKLKITNWADGNYDFDWAYAGAGQDSF